MRGTRIRRIARDIIPEELPEPVGAMDISPVFMSPISSAEPWPVQQKSFNIEGDPNAPYFRGPSPELPDVKTPPPMRKMSSPFKIPVFHATRAKSKKVSPKKLPAPIYELELSPVPIEKPLPTKKRSPPVLARGSPRAKPSSKGKEELSPPRAKPSSKGKEELSPLAVSPKKKKVAAPFIPPKKKHISKPRITAVPLPKKKSAVAIPASRKKPEMTPVPSAPPLETLTLEEFLVLNGVRPTRREILHSARQGRNIAPELADRSLVCSMLKDGSLSFGKYIKKGACGKINELLFRNQKGKYVVKSDFEPVSPECFQGKSVSFRRSDGNGETTFPRGSLLCTPAVSEFLLSLITGSLNQNFVHTIYLASCYSWGLIKDQFTLMEQLNGDIHHILPKMPQPFVEALYIQILYALALCQDMRIVHGDLHTGNVLYENVGEGGSAYPELVNAQYFSYKIGKNFITVPACPYIAKIADWGFGVKYSQPMIGNTRVSRGDDGIRPNFYTPAYDVAYITQLLYRYHKQNEMLVRVMSWMLRCNPKDIDNQFSKCFRTTGQLFGIPRLEALEDDRRLARVSAISVLTNPDLMGPYLNFQIPEGSTSIRLDLPRPSE